MERTYLKRKAVDDVLGGEDSWKNVDSTEGTSLFPDTSKMKQETNVFQSNLFFPPLLLYSSLFRRLASTLALISERSTSNSYMS